LALRSAAHAQAQVRPAALGSSPGETSGHAAAERARSAAVRAGRAAKRAVAHLGHRGRGLTTASGTAHCGGAVKETWRGERAAAGGRTVQHAGRVHRGVGRAGHSSAVWKTKERGMSKSPVGVCSPLRSTGRLVSGLLAGEYVLVHPLSCPSAAATAFAQTSAQTQPLRLQVGEGVSQQSTSHLEPAGRCSRRPRRFDRAQAIGSSPGHVKAARSLERTV
jgi:hypothetical protein